MHEFEVFCEMTFFDFKLPIFCTAFRGTRSPQFQQGDSTGDWPRAALSSAERRGYGASDGQECSPYVAVNETPRSH